MDTNAMRFTANMPSDRLGSKGHMLRDAAAEIDRLRSELDKLRRGMCEHATDTVWVDHGETAVDRISHVLGDGDWYNDVYLKEGQADATKV